MKTIKIIKVDDDCLLDSKYEIHINGSFYTSNISKKLKELYVNKFKALGYNILNISSYPTQDQIAIDQMPFNMG